MEVSCLLLAACLAGNATKLVGVGVVIGVESMMSIICLLYFSGFVCLLIVLALTICPLIPRMFSFVEVSLPSQMA